MAGFTQTQLEALEAAIAQGALTVRYADRSVTYHSLAEMLRLRDRMQREIAARGDGPPRPPARVSVFRRG